jgi:hypothetical protein
MKQDDSKRKALSSNTILAVAVGAATIVLIVFQFANNGAISFGIIAALPSYNVANEKAGGSYDIAFRESLGYFDDIPESDRSLN